MYGVVLATAATPGLPPPGQMPFLAQPNHPGPALDRSGNAQSLSATCMPCPVGAFSSLWGQIKHRSDDDEGPRNPGRRVVMILAVAAADEMPMALTGRRPQIRGPT